MGRDRVNHRDGDDDNHAAYAIAAPTLTQPLGPLQGQAAMPAMHSGVQRLSALGIAPTPLVPIIETSDSETTLALPQPDTQPDTQTDTQTDAQSAHRLRANRSGGSLGGSNGGAKLPLVPSSSSSSSATAASSFGSAASEPVALAPLPVHTSQRRHRRIRLPATAHGVKGQGGSGGGGGDDDDSSSSSDDEELCARRRRHAAPTERVRMLPRVFPTVPTLCVCLVLVEFCRVAFLALKCVFCATTHRVPVCV